MKHSVLENNKEKKGTAFTKTSPLPKDYVTTLWKKLDAFDMMKGLAHLF